SAVWDRREECIDAFEQAWRSGTRPDIAEFLPSDSDDRRAVLVELLQVDIEFRKQAGESACLDDYLQRFPELAAESSDLTPNSCGLDTSGFHKGSDVATGDTTIIQRAGAVIASAEAPVKEKSSG